MELKIITVTTITAEQFFVSILPGHLVLMINVVFILLTLMLMLIMCFVYIPSCQSIKMSGKLQWDHMAIVS